MHILEVEGSGTGNLGDGMGSSITLANVWSASSGTYGSDGGRLARG